MFVCGLMVVKETQAKGMMPIYLFIVEMFGNSGKARVPSSDDLIATPSAGPTSATAAAAAGAGAGAGAADDNVSPYQCPESEALLRYRTRS